MTWIGLYQIKDLDCLADLMFERLIHYGLELFDLLIGSLNDIIAWFVVQIDEIIWEGFCNAGNYILNVEDNARLFHIIIRRHLHKLSLEFFHINLWSDDVSSKIKIGVKNLNLSTYLVFLIFLKSLLKD